MKADVLLMLAEVRKCVRACARTRLWGRLRALKRVYVFGRTR